MARMEFKGAAASTTITAGITNSSTSFAIAVSTGWPTGAVGSFTVVVDPGTSSEEKMLCSALSGGTLTVTTRGYDGTSAVAHVAGAVIYPCISAVEMDALDALLNFHTAYSSKTTPVDADEIPMVDSAASFGFVRLTWANIKATLASLAQTLTNKDLSSSTNVLPPSYESGKNKILNGDFSIWQRGMSFTASGYCADRWYATIVGTTTVSQETTIIPPNSASCLKWVTGAAASYAQIRQYLRKSVVQSLRGKTLTLQAQVQCSAAFAGNLTFEVYYSTATDAITGFTGTALSIANPTGQIVSSGFTLITGQITVPANAVGLYFGVVPTVVQATGQTAYIGETQMEIGSRTTAFQTATGNPASELQECLRSFQKLVDYSDNGAAAWVGMFQAISATAVFGVMRLIAPMWTTPTITFSGNTDFLITGPGGGSSATATISAQQATPTSFRIDATNAGGLVAGNASSIYTSPTTGKITASAELT